MELRKLFGNFRRYAVRSKILIQRTLSYVAIMNSAMILFLVLSKLQDYGLEIYITKWFIPIYICGFIVLLGFGWLEDRVGFHKEELGQKAIINPYTRAWMKKFSSIEEKLDKVEKRLSRLEKRER